MDAGLDTGDILSAHPIEITAEETSKSLHDKLSDSGANAIVETLDKLDQDLIRPQVQDSELANYAHKLHKSDQGTYLKVRKINPDIKVNQGGVRGDDVSPDQAANCKRILIWRPRSPVEKVHCRRYTIYRR